MKNIQIIDGALNATYSIFQVTDEQFAVIFPAAGQDIETIEDLVARAGTDGAEAALAGVWERPILKSHAMGIHGTLYYVDLERRSRLPASKREVDYDGVNWAQKKLFDSLRG